MEVRTLSIAGCFVVRPTLRADSRGYFMESFNRRDFEAATGVSGDFVQDNQSFSRRGVLRGLHYQVGEFAQAKLVRVIQGEVLDVAVDIRPGSPTYGKYVAEVLSAENRLQMYIPKGFAHGFLVLSESAVFAYKCDNYYSQEHEGGLAYNDTSIGIEWPSSGLEFIISERDLHLPELSSARPVW